jgi:Glu-tRNA(Gln) amidotransferase subunit E-like FAD-binding protein
MTYLDLTDIIEFNKVMTNKFSKEQLEEFIRLIAADNETAYNNAVESFYVDTMEFDYEDVEDLINSVKSGNPNAIKRFIEDIDNYCK